MGISIKSHPLTGYTPTKDDQAKARGVIEAAYGGPWPGNGFVYATAGYKASDSDDVIAAMVREVKAAVGGMHGTPDSLANHWYSVGGTLDDARESGSGNEGGGGDGGGEPIPPQPIPPTGDAVTQGQFAVLQAQVSQHEAYLVTLGYVPPGPGING